MKLHQRIERIYALPRIGRVNRDVLLCLAVHADSKGLCWPGIRLIAKETEVAYRHVRTALENLAHFGLIAITPGNSRRSARYILRLPAVGKGESLGDSLRNPRGFRTVHEQSIYCTDCGRYHSPKIPKLGVHCMHCHKVPTDTLLDSLCTDCRVKAEHRWVAAKGRTKSLPAV